MRAVCLLVLVLAACQPFRPTPLPSPQLPATYVPSQGNWTIPDAWWTAWGAADLDAWIGRALAHGYDLRIAQARLQQAQAAARKVYSARWPGLSADLSPERRISGASGATTSADPVWTLTGLASYEVDLWGRIGAKTEVADLAVLQSEEALRTAAMTVSAELASAWIDLVAARAQAQVVRRQIAEQERLFTSLIDRYHGGAATLTEVENQRKALAEIRAALPSLEATALARKAQLATLCAFDSAADVEPTTSELPPPWPLPHAGIPAALLEARPDIRAKALAAVSAGWDVAVAKADLLPALTITGRLTASGPSLGGVFDSWVVRLLATLAQPILDGGMRRAEVARATAAQEEAILAYTQTVARAVAEVDTALAAVQSARQGLQQTLLRLAAARHILAATTDRYQYGAAEYPDLAQAVLQVHSLERAVIQQHASLLLQHVTLVRALGKGWQSILPLEEHRAPVS